MMKYQMLVPLVRLLSIVLTHVAQSIVLLQHFNPNVLKLVLELDYISGPTVDPQRWLYHDSHEKNLGMSY